MPRLDIPEAFLCPISLQLMTDPVFTSDGQTYDGASIRQWFDEKKTTSPLTGVPLKHTELIPNWSMKSALNSFHQKHISDSNLKTALLQGDLKTLETCWCIDTQHNVILLYQLIAKPNGKKLEVCQWLIQQFGSKIVDRQALIAALLLETGKPIVEYLLSVKPKLLIEIPDHAVMFYAHSLDTIQYLMPMQQQPFHTGMTDFNGNTLFHFFMTYGTPLPVALHWLEQKDANLWKENMEGNLPIYTLVAGTDIEETVFAPIFDKMASMMGDNKQKLLQHRNKDKLSLLEYAVDAGSVLSMKYVLRHYPELLKAAVVNDSKYTLVHFLAHRIDDMKIAGICVEALRMLQKKDPSLMAKMVLHKSSDQLSPLEVVLKHVMEMDEPSFENVLSFLQELLRQGSSVMEIHSVVEAELKKQSDLKKQSELKKQSAPPNYLAPLMQFLCRNVVMNAQENQKLKEEKAELLLLIPQKSRASKRIQDQNDRKDQHKKIKLDK